MPANKENYCWEAFTLYANKVGIDLNNKEDYEAWWECWKTAIDSHLESIKKYLKEQERIKSLDPEERFKELLKLRKGEKELEVQYGKDWSTSVAIKTKGD